MRRGLLLAAGALLLLLALALGWARSLFTVAGARHVESLPAALGAHSLVALFAHPDDEIKVAGLLADAGARGLRAHLVTAARGDTSIEKLAKLGPAFDRKSGAGTITAGNSSPLTDGAAGLWVATEAGLGRLPAELPRVKLVDHEMAAVDIFHEGLLMAPVAAIPRMLARHKLRYEDIALWELHEAFSAQIACHLKGLADEKYLREKAGVPHTFGRFPIERMNPNGGSVALGHPFGATGARILSQAVKELAALPAGSRSVVSVCADGGVGTVALLER
jgi:acetyl-CoA C-acetyltransferase